MNLSFDMQRFGGGKGGSSTTVQSYQPTKEEIRLQKATADYADAVSPNALYLNDVARSLLQDSIGTIQVDYNTLNENAQRQIANAMGNLAGLTASNAGAASAANDTLANISNQYGQAATRNFGRLAGLADQYGTAADRANATLGRLQDGYIPGEYQRNMEDSIRSALANTIGANVNSLGQRGVLNSSVTNSALNDIERNASNAVAQNYLQNINTVGSLAQQQLGNANNAIGAQGNIYNTQYGQLTDALGAQAGAAQQQMQNTLGANQMNAGTYESLIGNATAPIATAATAQEAAQTPATNLWNASLGLNSATTGALAASAGKGTTTQTTTQSGGGNFLGGLLGAGLQAWCFPAGTMVHMADGTKKDIKDVEAGDLVLSKDGKAQSVVTKMDEHENDVYEVVTDDGKRTRATLSQPFLMADGSWEELLGIEVRAELKNVGRVKSVTRVGKMTVYDFETAGDNTYVVDDGFVAQGGSADIWGRQ